MCGNPAQLWMFQILWRSGYNRRLEKCQMDGSFRIFMSQLCKNLAHTDGNAQLFPTFPNQCLLTALAGFNFSTCKFPK